MVESVEENVPSGRSWSRAAIAASWLEYVPGLCLALAVFTWALRQVGPSRIDRFWDDALFFRRVAHNIVHHGVGAWNMSDGPVFVNTSQLFQMVAAAVLAVFPRYYNAAIIFWSAACLCLCCWTLWRAVRGGLLEAFAAFGLWLAPPAFLSVTTGMETATALMVLCASIYVALRAPLPRFWLPLATMIELAVYLVRPDAILLSLTTHVALLAVQGKMRHALQLALMTSLGIGLLSLGFLAYYGTPLPLAAYLKVSPFSVYDQSYLSFGAAGKVLNLTQMAVCLLAVIPLIACQRDRTNLVLCSVGAAFIAYHGLTTNEIMAAHARFYAPALPFFFTAALRGVARARSITMPTWKRWALVGSSAVTGAIAWFAFRQDWVETRLGRFGLGHQYLDYFAVTAVVGILLLCSSRVRRWAVPAASIGILGYQVMSTVPPVAGVVSDAESDLAVYANNSGQVGIDVILRCFKEPVQIMHSELGIPGVLFPESRILDFTGLANPAVVHETFDFEQVCETARPEFIFRPHPTHQRLNRELDSSPCLAKNYTRVRSRKYTSCPLHVRKDLMPQFLACQG
jgi:hypothetical protein